MGQTDKTRLVNVRYDRDRNWFIATMPDGTIIPAQTEMTIHDSISNPGFIEATFRCQVYFDADWRPDEADSPANT